MTKILPIAIVFLFLAFSCSSPEKPGETIIPLRAGEKIWSGAIKEGNNMPFKDGYRFDFYANNNYNQIQPLLLGDKGLWVWSEEPFAFEVKSGELIITKALGKIEYGHAGNTLAEARSYASATYFPASGKMPDSLLFSKPQYNTWIELTYNQNQEDVLKYARAIIDNGFDPGVLMIDDTWQEDYGLWKFHPGRFPNPKQMMDELHRMGFKVMVWMCPFVSGDQALVVREIMKDKGFLMQKTNDKPSWEKATDPAMIRWWNGYSALLDFTNPASVKWFNGELDRIVKDYGVDGFKLDAGDMDFYPATALSKEPATPNRQCELYAQFGLRFTLNEYRACWKMAGQPLAQRLHDKNHNWEDVQKLIPHMITEGLAGYTFSCPDLIGGGDYISFLNAKTMDQELVVRSAQIHALMPMMQFSVAPWRILNKENLSICKRAADLHTQFGPEILKIAAQSAATGDPIVMHMEYLFPDQGFANTIDQFMLGTDILVAPVVNKGERSRMVKFPKGKWKADDGTIYNGPAEIKINAPLERLPWFRKTI